VSSMLHKENLPRSMITGFKSGETNEGISRSYLWLGAIILAAVVTFWLAYPVTGLVTPGTDATQAEQHDDD